MRTPRLHSAQINKAKSNKIGTWSKLVALCTHVLGGYYRSNGTIVRNIAQGKVNSADDEHIFVETDVQFASIQERTHSRFRHLETQRQQNIESILSIVSSLLGEKVTMKAVDPDWAMVFFNYAQDVSNQSLQSLWARALLSELRHPNSISKRSLSFLYHCDLWEINAFKKVAHYAFIGSNGHPFIFRSTADAYRKDDIFNEQRLLSHCIIAGLIHQDPQNLLVGFSFAYDGKPYKVTHDMTPLGQPVGFYVQPFSKTGSDLLKLMGGLKAIPSSNMNRRVVWDYLCDYLDFEVVEAAQEDEALVG